MAVKHPTGLRPFGTTRLVMGGDHQLHEQEMTVLAVSGPEAARLVNEAVAEAYKANAPKD